jgi:molybdenum cofactor biosynthesis protein B
MVHKDATEPKLNILVITVSTSRNEKTDVSGENLREEFSKDLHSVDKVMCGDDEMGILDAFLSHPEKDVFIFVGGTGPSRRDVTVETLRKISTKEMAGFGEMFRVESRERLAFLSNATLFLKGKKQIYCVPGSPDAVRLAHSIIGSVMGHIYNELNKE